jgi:hypothetical protein
MQTLDTTFTYKPANAGIEARCRLRAYAHDGKAIFLLTELPDNPGMSVTNAIDQIATKLLAQYMVEPSEAIFIEHYPADSARPQDTYDEVTLNCRQRATLDGKHHPWIAENPQWRRLTLEEVEIVTGANLSPMNRALADFGLETADGRDFDDWDAWEVS